MISVTGGAARAVASGPSTLDDVQLTPDGKTIDLHRAERLAAGRRSSALLPAAAPASPLTRLNDELLAKYQLTPAEEFWTEGRGDRRRSTAFWSSRRAFRPDGKYPVLFLIHGGPAGRLGRELDLPLERAGVRGRGLRGGDAEPAGLDRLRAEVHRRDQRRLGRQGLRRHHGGGRLRRPAALCRSRSALAAAGASYGGYMVDWMLGPHHALQGAGFARGRLRPAQRVRRDRGAVVPAVGIPRRALGRPGDVRALVPELLREGVQDARRWSPTASWTTAFPWARGCSCSPRCSSRRSRRSWCCSPTKATGSRSRKTASSGTRRSSIGSIPG